MVGMKRKASESVAAGAIVAIAALSFMDNKAPVMVRDIKIPGPAVHGLVTAGADMLGSYATDFVSSYVDPKGKLENLIHPLATAGLTYGATKTNDEYNAWANKNNNPLLSTGLAGGGAFLAEMAVDMLPGKKKK